MKPTVETVNFNKHFWNVYLRKEEMLWRKRKKIHKKMLRVPYRLRFCRIYLTKERDPFKWLDIDGSNFQLENTFIEWLIKKNANNY